MNIFSDQRPLFGQDPHITRYKDELLLCESVDERLICISVLKEGRRFSTKIVWTPSYQQVWAPELHQIDGLWFIYYAASDGRNENHRMFVLGAANNPFGPYNFAQQIGPNSWGIDMTTFAWQKQRYAVWSGWEDNKEFPQNLYIAPMISPVEIGASRGLSYPQYDWELSVKPINEGPQAFIKDNRLFLLFAANASWSVEYATGLLELIAVEPLNPWHWVKRDRPLMTNAGHGMIEGGTFYYHRKQSLIDGWTDREIRTLPAGQLLG